MNNNRINVYLNTNDKIKYLYDRTGISMVADTLALKHNISSTLIDKMEFTIGDIILGFYKVEDTVPLLQQELAVDAKTAALLGADVLDFLAPLSDPNFVMPTDENTGVINTPSNASETTGKATEGQLTSSQYLPSAETPEMHTMASDASEARANFEPVTEQVYSSEQPDLRKNLSDLPSYALPFDQNPSNTTPKAPIEPPRWGS